MHVFSCKRCSWFCTVILLMLAGCTAPATQYYVLSTVVPTQQIKPIHAKTHDIYQISIRELRIPRYLDRPRMVSRDTENHLRIAEIHQWGGRLRDDISRTLSDDLAERLPAATILTAPFPATMQSKESLFIDVRQFELLPDGYMHLKVRWHIQQAGVAVQNYSDHFMSVHKIGERDYAAMAASMSTLLAQLAEKMATALMQ